MGRRVLLPRPQLRAPPAWSASSCRASLVWSARQHGRGFGETDGVFRRFLRARSRDPGLAQGSKGEGRETGRSNASTTNQPTETRERQQQHLNPIQTASATYDPFVVRGSALRSALRPVPCSTPLRGVSRKVSKGGVPPPWPRHTAYPPIGRRCATPPPSHPVRRRSGGRFRRE